MDTYPQDRKYSKEHEWVLNLDDGTALIGITWYAQDQLGDIVYLSTLEEGEDVTAGDEIGEIESVKSVSQIFTPVSGKIIEINEEAINNPEIINQDPYEKGWIVKIELTNPAELNDLLDAEEYRNFIEEG